MKNDRYYTLNQSACAFHNWVCLGAPQHLTRAQVALLKAQSVPTVAKTTVTHFSFTGTLQPHEVKQFTLEKRCTPAISV